MKTFIGAHPSRKRYVFALTGAMLLIAMPAWAVTPVEVDFRPGYYDPLVFSVDQSEVTSLTFNGVEYSRE